MKHSINKINYYRYFDFAVVASSSICCTQGGYVEGYKLYTEKRIQAENLKVEQPAY